MHPWFSDHHDQLRARVREFARAEIAPVAARLDAESRFPWENVRKLADLGLLGINVPPDYGGLGLDYISYILVIEELARIDASHAITVSAHSTLATSPIQMFGTEPQRQRFLPLLARGRVLGGFGLTEPAAGSDAGATQTVALRETGGYRLNGSKIFITHAGVGEIFVVTALTDRTRGVRGISSFIVTKETTDRDAADRVGIGHAPELAPFTPGVRAGRKEDKMGWRASDTRELFLEDAFVPEADRLGDEGSGFTNFMRTLDAGRIGLAALSLGLAEGALDTALRYLNDGTNAAAAPGRQGVRFAVAELATGIAAARHLVYHAAWLRQNGQPFTSEAAMAKLFASELAMRVTSRVVHLLGTHGYTAEYPVERMLRDAKICEIGEGTSEVQKIVISRALIRDPGTATGPG